jgi:protein-tyrosine kinase
MSAVPSLVAKAGDHSIGAILVEAGRLRIEDAERIVRLQRERGMRFGDAAIALGLVGAADIEFALARQFGYRCLVPGASKVSRKLLAAYSASGPHVEALRDLRSQLMLRCFDDERGRSTLAVASPARGEGRSFIAASLAVIFSQLGERTLLIDADMRHGSQHELFGVDNHVGLSSVLSGRAGEDSVMRVPALADLSLLTAGPQPPNPPELLGRPAFRKLVADLHQRFDVILLDTPAADECGDAQTIAGACGKAIIVVRRHRTRLGRAKALRDGLRLCGAEVAGSVLNDF